MNSSDERDDGPSRREFLTRAGVLAGGIALLGTPAVQIAAAVQRSDAPGFSALELDGQFIDFLRSSEGGFPKGEVVLEPRVASDPVVRKRLGATTYQEITIGFAPAMPKQLFEWIGATLAAKPVSKSGAIITTDINRAEQSRLQFNNAMITEVVIPACDASIREPGYFAVKFAPEITTLTAGKGAPLPTVRAKSRQWLSSNFKLSIDGVDCDGVAAIDALTIKQKLQQIGAGHARVDRRPVELEIPNLVINISEASAASFYAWFQDAAIMGKPDTERDGNLEFFDVVQGGALLRIKFHRLGIFGFTPDKNGGDAERLARIKVEMYCEQITLS